MNSVIEKMKRYQSCQSYHNNNRTYKMRPIMAFPYYGGKLRFCSRIAGLLDYNANTYVEPFGGGASVLLNKAPHDKELYCDMSLALCCFWFCMKDKDSAFALIEKLYDTDYSEADFNSCTTLVNEFEASGRHLADLSDSEVLGIAAACFILFSFSRDSAGMRYHNGRTKKHEAYLRSVDRLIEVAERFSGTEVIHGDALHLLDGDKFDNVDTIIYLDPVYLPEAGKGKNSSDKLYRYQFDYAKHIRMLERVREMKCKILISGYEDGTRLYDSYLVDRKVAGKFTTWQKYEIAAISAVARENKLRTEVLWTNF